MSHVHNVYFWLSDGGGDTSFEQGLADLTNDPNVRAGYFGRPASTSREVVQNDYTYGLTLAFADRAGHDAYQAGQAHLRFLADHANKWDDVVVYDFNA